MLNRGAAAGDRASLGFLSDGREGSATNAGWTLADDRLERNAGDTAWETKTGKPLYVKVWGVEEAPVEAPLEAGVLVTNRYLALTPEQLSSPEASSSNAEQAQSFTTGAMDVELDGIVLHVSAFPDPKPSSVTIWIEPVGGTNDAGVQVPDVSGMATVATLTATDPELTEAGALLFSPDSNVRLDAGTTYFVVVNDDRGAGGVGYHAWSGDGERVATGASAGLSIGDGRVTRPDSDTPWSSSQRSLVMTVSGTEAPPRPAVSPMVLLSNDGLVNDQGDPVSPGSDPSVNASNGFQAQAFTVGARNVDLRWADLWWLSGVLPPNRSPAIHADDGGAPDLSASGLVATLDFDVVARDTGILTGKFQRFRAPDGTELVAGATYWVVVNRGEGLPGNYGHVSDTREGSATNAGWTLADDRLERNAGDTAWETRTGKPLFLSLAGVEEAPVEPPLEAGVLVTNRYLALTPEQLSSPEALSSNAVQAQSFTTGAMDVELDNIALHVSAFPDPKPSSVTIELNPSAGTNTSGVEVPDVRDEVLVARLTATDLELTEAGALFFTPSTAVRLDADTTYFVTVNIVEGQSPVGYYFWSGDGERVATGASAGWSIGDVSATTADGSLWTRSGHSLVMTVSGEEVAPEPDAPEAETLVTNDGLGLEPDGFTQVTNDAVTAQSFTTGPRGAAVAWIEAWNSQLPDERPASWILELFRDKDGAPDLDGDDGLVATFRTGAGADGIVVSGKPARYDVLADEVRLEAETVYWVVTNRGVQADTATETFRMGYGFIADGREGSDTIAGWSLGDDRLERTGGATAWATRTGQPLFVRVGGVEDAPPPPPPPSRGTLAGNIRLTDAQGDRVEASEAPAGTVDAEGRRRHFALQAQAFTTGVRNAELDRVVLWRSHLPRDTAARLLPVTIHADDGGAPDLDGDPVATLVYDDFVTDDFDDGNARVYLPETPADLRANTTYWVVVNRNAPDAEDERGSASHVSDTREDGDTLAGWSIADARLVRNAAGTAWETRTGEPLWLRLEGTEGAPPPPPTSRGNLVRNDNLGVSPPGLVDLTAEAVRRRQATQAQAFTTGPHDADVHRIVIWRSKLSDQIWDSLPVTIRLDDGGAPDLDGAPVATLDYDSETSEGGAQNNRFYQPAAAVRLLAETTYWVVADRGDFDDPELVASTGHISETRQGGRAGWSIADHRLERNADGTAWITRSGEPLWLRVEGTERASEPEGGLRLVTNASETASGASDAAQFQSFTTGKNEALLERIRLHHGGALPDPAPADWFVRVYADRNGAPDVGGISPALRTFRTTGPPAAGWQSYYAEGGALALEAGTTYWVGSNIGAGLEIEDGTVAYSRTLAEGQSSGSGVTSGWSIGDGRKGILADLTLVDEADPLLMEAIGQELGADQQASGVRLARTVSTDTRTCGGILREDLRRNFAHLDPRDPGVPDSCGEAVYALLRTHEPGGVEVSSVRLRLGGLPDPLPTAPVVKIMELESIRAAGRRQKDEASVHTVIDDEDDFQKTRPGRVLAAFRNPGTFTANALNVFTAPSPVFLEPRRNYLLAVNDGMGLAGSSPADYRVRNQYTPSGYTPLGVGDVAVWGRILFESGVSKADSLERDDEAVSNAVLIGSLDGHHLIPQFEVYGRAVQAATLLQSLRITAHGRELPLDFPLDNFRTKYRAGTGGASEVTVEAVARRTQSSVRIEGDDDPSTPGVAVIPVAAEGPTRFTVTVAGGGDVRVYTVVLEDGRGLDFSSHNRSRFWERDYAAGILSDAFARVHVPYASQRFTTGPAPDPGDPGTGASAYRFESATLKIDFWGASGVKARLYSDRNGLPFRQLAELAPAGPLTDGTVEFAAPRLLGGFPLLEPETAYHVMFVRDGSGAFLDLAATPDTGANAAGFSLDADSLAHILPSAYNEASAREPPGDRPVHPGDRDWNAYTCNRHETDQDCDNLRGEYGDDRLHTDSPGVGELVKLINRAQGAGTPEEVARARAEREAFFRNTFGIAPGEPSVVLEWSETAQDWLKLTPERYGPGQTYILARGFDVAWGWNVMTGRQLAVKLAGGPVTGAAPGFNLPPRPVDAAVDAAGTALWIAYDNPVDGAAMPPASAFRVEVSDLPGEWLGAEVASVSVSAEDRRVTLGLAGPVWPTQEVRVSYADPTEEDDLAAVQSPAGTDAPGFERRRVRNGSEADDPRPQAVSAAVDATGLQLSVTFDETLDSVTSRRPPREAFTVTATNVLGGRETVAATGVSIRGRVLTLALARAVTAGETVAVDYRDPSPGVDDTRAVQSRAGADSPGFLGLVAANGSEVVDPFPKPVSAALLASGHEIDIVFHVELEDRLGRTPRPSAFSLTSEAGVNSVGHVQVFGPERKVRLTLNADVHAGADVTVSYADPTAGDDREAVQSPQGHDAPGFAELEVTNGSALPHPDDRAPALLRAEFPQSLGMVDRAFIRLDFRHPVDRRPAVIDGAKNRFSVTANGAAVIVSSVARSVDAFGLRGGPRTLYLVVDDSQIPSGASVELAYGDLTSGDDEADVIQSLGGTDMLGTRGVQVTDQAPVTGAPALVGAAFPRDDANALDRSLVALTFDRAVDRRPATLAGAESGFTVQVVDGDDVTNHPVRAVTASPGPGFPAAPKLLYLRLAGAAAHEPGVTLASVRYLDRTSGADDSSGVVQADAGGADMADLDATEIGEAPDRGPRVLEAWSAVDGLYLRFDVDLDRSDGRLPPASAFVVNRNGVFLSAISVVNPDTEFDEDWGPRVVFVEVDAGHGWSGSVEYTPPTSGDAAFQSAAGVKADGFEIDVPARRAGAPPGLRRAVFPRDDDNAPDRTRILLVFDRGLETGGTAGVGNLLTVTEGGFVRSVEEVAVANREAEDGTVSGEATLTFATALSAEAAVRVAYADLAGNQSSGVFQATDGADAASFGPVIVTPERSGTPAAQSAWMRHDGSGFYLRFEAAVDRRASRLPPADAFAVTAGGEAVTPTRVVDPDAAFGEDWGARVIFVEADMGFALEGVAEYGPPASGDRAVQGTDGVKAGAFSIAVAGAPEPRPVSVSFRAAAGEVDRTRIDLDFHRDLDRDAATLAALAQRFTVRSGASVLAVDGIEAPEGEDRRLTLRLAAAAPARAATLSYADPAGNQSAGVVQSRTGRDARSFGPVAVAVPHVPEPPRLLEAFFVDDDGTLPGDDFWMVFDRDLDPAPSLTAGLLARFTATVNGAPATLTLAGIRTPNRAFVTLDPTAPVGASVAVAYADPAGNQADGVIQGAEGVDAASFTATAAVEFQPAPKPVSAMFARDASGTLHRDLVALAFDRTMNRDVGSLSGAEERFALTGGGATHEVSAVVADPSDATGTFAAGPRTVFLRLAAPAPVSAAAPELAYTAYSTAQTTAVMQSAAGVDAASFTVTVTEPAPRPVSARIRHDGSGVRLVFDTALDRRAGRLPPASAFTVTAGGSRVTVTAVVDPDAEFGETGGANAIFLKAATGLAASGRVDYVPPASGEAAVQNASGLKAEAFSVAVAPALPPGPVLREAYFPEDEGFLDRNDLWLVFDRDLDPAPDRTESLRARFAATADGAALTLVDAGFGGLNPDRAYVTFDPAPAAGASVTLVYTDPPGDQAGDAADGVIQNTEGVDAASFTVTLSVALPPAPEPVSAAFPRDASGTLHRDLVALTFDREMARDAQALGGAEARFALTAGGVAYTVSGVVADPSDAASSFATGRATVFLRLAAPVPASTASVQLAYTAYSSAQITAVMESAAGVDAASFTQAVTAPAPAPLSARIRHDGSGVYVSFDAALDRRASRLPPASAFTVTADGSAVSVTGVADPDAEFGESGGANVIFLRAATGLAASGRVAYAPPASGDRAVQGTTGLKAAAFEVEVEPAAAPPPVLREAHFLLDERVLERGTVILAFDRALAPVRALGGTLHTRFTATSGGETFAAAAARSHGSSENGIIVTFDDGFAAGASVTLAYAAPVGDRQAGVIQGAEGSDALSFTVTLTVEAPPAPAPVSARFPRDADGTLHRDLVALAFDRDMERSAQALGGAEARFALTAGGVAYTVSDVVADPSGGGTAFAAGPRTVYLELAGAVPASEASASLAYTAHSGDVVEAVMESAAGADAASFTETVTDAPQGTRSGARSEGAPLTARFTEAPPGHGGEPFVLGLSFSEALAGADAGEGAAEAWAARIEAALSVEGGLLTVAAPAAGGGTRDWELALAPLEAGAAVTVTLAPAEDCAVKGAFCTKDGRTLAEAATAEIPGAVPTHVTSVRIVSEPGDNGAWDAGEAVVAEIAFNREVQLYGPPGAALPTVGILLGGARREAAYEAGSETRVLRFRHAVAARDGGARTAEIVADSLDPGGVLLVDNLGGEAVLAFTPEGPPPLLTVTRRVAENAPPGTPVGAPVTATDPEGDTLAYALLDRASGEATGRFAIDAATGQVSTVADVLYDYETRPAYALVVTADDGNGNVARTGLDVELVDVEEVLTAAFEDVPAAHGGAAFTVRIRFSEPAAFGPEGLEAALAVTGGEVRAAWRADLGHGLPEGLGLAWEARIAPGLGPVTLALAAAADCAAPGAACTADGRPLSAAVRAEAALGALPPLRAAKAEHPAAQAREPIDLGLSFNAPVTVTAAAMRAHALAAENAEVTDVARRDGDGRTWRIRVLPLSNAALSVTLAAATDCAAPGAVCTPDGRMLEEAVAWEIAGASAPDGDPPVPEGAELRLGALEIVFAEGLDEASVPPASAFAVTVGGAARALAGTDPVRVEGRRVHLALAAPAKDGEAAAVSYTPPADGEAARLRDVAGNAAAAFGDLAAENATPRFTARFEGLPETHDGVHRFRFRLVFSEPPAPGLTADAIRFGKLSQRIGATRPFKVPWLARRHPEGMEWLVVASFRNSDAELAGETLRFELAPTADCAEAGALCTADGRRLKARVAAEVPGAPSLTAEDAAAVEGPEAKLSFLVRLSTPQAEAVTVDWATADGSAAADEDYVAASGTLSFAPGETERTVAVALLDDAEAEGDETMALRLSGPAGAGTVLRRAEAAGTVTDDEAPSFTAAFEGLPERHSGAPFEAGIAFGAAPASSVDAAALLAALGVTGGEATAAARPDAADAARWRVTVAPDTAWGAVGLSLAPAEDCAAEGALCSAAGEALAAAAQAAVPGSDAARAVAARIVSEPGENGTWDEGETVEAELDFSQAVTVGGPAGTAPKLAVLLDGERREAVYARGSGTATLAFALVVAAADAGAAWARVAPDGLVPDGATVTGEDGRAALTRFFVAPWVTEAGFLPDASGDGTWSGGEKLEVRLEFSEPVAVTGGVPEIGVTMHGFATELVQAAGSGTEHLVFEREILSGALAGSAIELPAGELSLEGAEIVSVASGLAAETAFGAASAREPLDVVAPAPVGAVADGSALVLTYDEALDGESVPGADAFAVTVAGAARALAAADPVAVSGRTVTLALAAPVAHGEAVTAGYAPPADGDAGVGPLRDLAGNPAAAFAGFEAQNATPEEAAALTGAFSGAPAGHGGEAFTLELAFSESPEMTRRALRRVDGQEGTLWVTHATVERIQRVEAGSNLRWRIAFAPVGEGTEDVTVTLPPTADCDDAGAICMADGRPLSAAVTVTVPHAAAPEEAPFAARLEGLPAEHDGESAVAFEVHFSEEPHGYSFRTLRDETLEILQDGERLAPRVQRTNKPSNRAWGVTVEPASKADITVAIAAVADCAEAGAVCTEGGMPLSNGVSATVPGPPGLSVADAEVREGPGATLDFRVALSRASSSVVTVDYATSDGSASAGDDYAATSGTLRFEAGETARTVSVPVIDDAVDDDGETLTLVLSNPSGGNAYVSDGTATGTIRNRDPLQKAWISRFGRTVGSQALEAVMDRFDGGGRTHVTLGGRPLPLGGGSAARAGAGADDASRRTQETTGPGERSILGREKTGADERSILGREKSGADERSILGQEKTGADERSILGQEKNGAGERSILGQEKTGAGERSILGQEKTGAGERSILGQEKTGADERSILGQEKTGAGERSILGQEKTGAGERSILGQEKTGAGGALLMTHGNPGEDELSILLREKTRMRMEEAGEVEKLVAQWLRSGVRGDERLVFPDLDTLMLGSSFNFPLGQGEAGPGSRGKWSAWGRFARDSFRGGTEGLSLEGDVTTGFVGMDKESGAWLWGAALGISEGEGPFRMSGSGGSGTAEDEGPGRMDSRLTAVYPYGRHSVTDRLDVWAMGGYGQGTMTVESAGGPALETDLGMALGAVGAQGALRKPPPGGGIALVLRADALWVRTESEALRGEGGFLSGAVADTSRVRLILEGKRHYRLSDDRFITPALELAVRRDGGDAETGTGIETGARVSYRRQNLTVEGAVRTLLSHEEKEYGEWGASASIRLESGRDGRGLWFSLAPSWGAPGSAAERLWGLDDTRGLAPEGEFEAGRRIDAGVGYGMPVFGGRFTGTPELGVGLSDGVRDYRIGWRLVPVGGGIGPLGSFGITMEAARQVASRGEAESRFGAVLEARF